MDNILDKFGLYDFFGLLLPGMYFLLVLDLLGIPQLINIQYPTNEAIMIVMFIIFSYIIGTLIQEIASLFDRYVIRIRKRAMTRYLDDINTNNTTTNNIVAKIKSKVVNFFYDIESRLTKKELETAKQWIVVEENDSEKEEKCISAFFEFKSYLEIKGKMGKANKLDAMYAMSRDLFVCNLIIGLYLGKNCICKRAINSIEIAFLIYAVVSLLILSERAYRYANMRVRTIIRQYISLKKEEITSQPQDE